MKFSKKVLLFFVWILNSGCGDDAKELASESQGSLTVKGLKSIVHDPDLNYLTLITRNSDSLITTVYVWDLNTGQNTTITFDSLAKNISVDKNEMAVFSNKDVSIYSLDKVKLQNVFPLPSTDLELVGYKRSKDGAFLIGVQFHLPQFRRRTDRAGDRVIEFFHADSAKSYRRFECTDEYYFDWAVDSDIKYLATSSYPSRTLEIRNIHEMRISNSLKTENLIRPFSFSRNSRFFYWGTLDGNLHVLDLLSNSQKEFDHDRSNFRTFIIHSSNSDLVLVPKGDRIDFYDLESSERKFFLKSDRKLVGANSTGSTLIFLKSFQNTISEVTVAELKIDTYLNRN